MKMKKDLIDKEREDARLPTKLSDREKTSIEGMLSRNKEVKACLNCGGINIRLVPATKDKTSLGVAKQPEVYGAYLCEDCRHQGAPIIFKSLSALEKFHRTKRQKHNMRQDEAEANDFLVNPFSGAKKPLLSGLLGRILRKQ